MDQGARYFGTDGIRGRVGDAVINPQFMLHLGWVIGEFLKESAAKQTAEKPSIAVGRDTRISGYVLQSALQAGLLAAGVQVYMLGVMPTPAVAYLTRYLKADAGLVISASHNPYYDNGIKLFDAFGKKLSDAAENSIEQKLAAPLTMAASDQLAIVKRIGDAKDIYSQFCMDNFPLNLKKLKCVVDCAHGATYQIAPSLLRELGAEVIPIGVEPDGLNINKDVGSTHLDALRTKVLQEKADFGVAFDGDGDRLLLVDHLGEIVDGDEIVGILALSEGVHLDGVVGTQMTNLGLEQALAAKKIPLVRTKVGDRFVMEELEKRHWRLGGEASGHVINLDYATTGDGIITALQILRLMVLQKKTLHELKKLMVKRPQILINIATTKKISLDDFPVIHECVKKAEEKLQDQGRVLLRVSGTEPLIRVMVEGNNADLVREIAQNIASTVEQVVRRDS